MTSGFLGSDLRCEFFVNAVSRGAELSGGVIRKISAVDQYDLLSALRSASPHL